MSRLVVVGAGGHGRVVADAAQATWADIVFLDDRYPETRRSAVWPVVGKIDDLRRAADTGAQFVVAIGDARTRLRILETLQELRLPIASVIHPRAFISDNATFGAGAVLAAGACVNVGARLGRGVIVNTGATVDHDCVLRDGVHVCPGANLAGGVQVGEGAWLGIGASVIQGVAIGSYATVGAGAVVINDVPAGATVVGVPARVKVS